MIDYVFGAETVGVFLSKQTVHVGSCIVKFFVAREEYLVVVVTDDSNQIWHLFCTYFFPYLIANEEQSCFGVVCYLVYLFGVEIVQDWYSHGTICNGC